jgi:hypothetical protein
MRHENDVSSVCFVPNFLHRKISSDFFVTGIIKSKQINFLSQQIKNHNINNSNQKTRQRRGAAGQRTG